MVLKVECLGYEIGFNKLKPLHYKLAGIQKLSSSTVKVALIRLKSARNFVTKLIEKLHINTESINDLLRKSTPWNWTPDF